MQSEKKEDMINDIKRSSEKRSVTENCGTEYYSCDSGECIPREKACNRNYDCTDGSDEMKCEYFLAAQRAYTKSTIATDTNTFSKFGEDTTNQEGNLYNHKSDVGNRNIFAPFDNEESQYHKGYGSDHRHFSSFDKTGQYDNAHAWTTSDRTGYNRNKTDKNHNGNTIENGNDNQNVYNYILNTFNHNGRNEQHRNGLTGDVGCDTCENHQYKELRGRVSEIQQANHMQQLSSNDQNILNQGLNYGSNGLSSSTISESFGGYVDSLFRRNGTKNESYHSGIIYNKIETRSGTNQISDTNQNNNGIDETNEEDGDECSDQEFRCPYLPKTLCVHYMKICDGIDDCGDGSDETNCADDGANALTISGESIATTIATTGCESDQFRCENGKCIAKIHQCDHKYDCDDGTDESICEYFVQALQQARSTTIHPGETEEEIMPSYAESEKPKQDQVEGDEEWRVQEKEKVGKEKELKEEQERQQKRREEEEERQQREEERERAEKKRIREEYYEKERRRQEIEQQRREKEYEREKEDGQEQGEWERQEKEKVRQEMESGRQEHGRIKQEMELGRQQGKQKSEEDAKDGLFDKEWKSFEEEQQQSYRENEQRRQEEERKRQKEKEEEDGQRLEEDQRRLEEDRRRVEEDRRQIEEDRRNVEKDRRLVEELSRVNYGESRKKPEMEEKVEDTGKYEKHQMTVEGVRIRESEERRRLELEGYDRDKENEIDNDGYTDANARERYEVVEAGEICTIQQYQCVSGECIERTAHCDGKTDCSDGSDEMLCHSATEKQSVSQFSKPTACFCFISLHLTS
ncbi:unnamed protein product [Cercopithifilaria johnstoni]|uniref:Uncharacterized protein n=1 Tax=Cercopithifilaria johnstoni TaxID=2874296 RepID=A0A8J2PY63_9BILA|nr:unnamed protein product [Cercopithifilaria johnstoni]